MRIITIGLGGAGCRIADSLYSIDRRSSRVACIQSLAVDVDERTLQQLTGIPDTLKVYFPPFDPGNPDTPHGAGPTATIDIAEIVSRVHNFESGENDAIFICCGLGGRMADIVPHVIAGLRASITEPIFGLVTLPCLAEGAKRSSKAADDIDILSPLLDGMILFDNETWYKKIRARPAEPVRKEKGLAGIFGFGKEEPEPSPEMITYLRLNDAIVRRISLILKAGEFRADGGIDHAEVVLDSGEVLNTMKGGGFITIGYAVEKLPSNPLAFLSPLKPAGLFNEESKKKASRIVELAKQAIYHEVSTPCDMTSAHKALVLVAGPSHEISMQGFMTVRKWIDRSISGIEMRSGDYPVMNTTNVAVIIMLSGLDNIPRVSELREIREQARRGPVQRPVPEEEVANNPQLPGESGLIKDEMIVLPTTMQKRPGDSRGEDGISRRDEHRVPNTSARTRPIQQYPSQPNPIQGTHIPPHQAGPRRPHISEEDPHQTPVNTYAPRPPVAPQSPYGQPRNLPSQQPLPREPAPPSNPPTTSRTPHPVQSPEPSRQRIEQELQRQRMMALSGSASPNQPMTPPTEHRIRQNELPKQSLTGSEGIRAQAPVQEEFPQTPVTRRVIIRKRTPVQTAPELESYETLPPSENNAKGAETTPVSPTAHHPITEAPKTKGLSMKDPSFRAKDSVFAGKEIRTSVVPKVKDAALLDSGLKPKKSILHHADEKKLVNTAGNRDAEDPDEPPREKTVKKRDDLSWI